VSNWYVHERDLSPRTSRVVSTRQGDGQSGRLKRRTRCGDWFCGLQHSAFDRSTHLRTMVVWLPVSAPRRVHLGPGRPELSCFKLRRNRELGDRQPPVRPPVRRPRADRERAGFEGPKTKKTPEPVQASGASGTRKLRVARLLIRSRVRILVPRAASLHLGLELRTELLRLRLLRGGQDRADFRGDLRVENSHVLVNRGDGL
jgi:hypothetical protein